MGTSLETVSESCTAPAVVSAEIRGTALPRGATGCTSFLARVARVRWPRKTAQHWAAAAGVKERMAKYWLAGHPVSPAGRLALIGELHIAD